MKRNNIIIYLIIPITLFSALSLFYNVEAQTNSTTANNQTTTITSQTQQQPQNQNANLTAQSLVKTDIVELNNNLINAKLAIVDGNLKQALEDVINVETQLVRLEPSPPTKFINNIHKAISAIAQSDIDKALNTLTNIEVSILKAENMIFKAAVTNPEIIQPIKDSVIKPKQMHQINTEKQFDAEKQYDPVEEYDNAGLNTNLIDFTNINK
ncbi:MAG TPA: hypothetical protein VFV86_10090 [Nitrososphaeraceae archaeon]|nr:hypothetical protein [Nitrososphaeraceae archaeon]